MVFLNTHIDRLDLPAALAAVSEQRRQQALQFRHDAGRRQCLAAFLLLNDALRTRHGLPTNPRLVYDDGGKPRLADHPALHFNLSHCAVAAACVVDTVPVGVDVEQVRPVNADVVAYTMNADEQEQIRRAPRPDVAFIRLWTRKEAVLKLTGEGLTQHLTDVLTAHADAVTLATAVSPDLRYVVSVARYRR